MHRSLPYLLLLLLALTGCGGGSPPAPAPPPTAAPTTQHAAHPDVADPADWCKGHAIPESKCTVCNPELIPAFKASGDWCAEHGYPESACPTCNPMAPPGSSAAPSEGAFAPGTRIRFRTAETEARSGIEVAQAGVSSVAVGVQATARIAFDADRVAEIRTPTGGVVRELRAAVGDLVSRGTVLAVLDNAEVGELRARLASARERERTASANLARQKELGAAGVASARDGELAAQEVEAAASDVRAIEAALATTGASGSGVSGRYTLTSPIGGRVIRRPVSLGAAVTDRDLLALVADTSRVWAMLDVQEEDVAHVRIGQPVSLLVDGVPGRTFTGTITWLSSEVDPRTRTVTARSELDNPDGLLRANQFGRATIEVEPSADVVAVPTGAVQRLDDGAVVFVRSEPGVYEPRAVDVGRRSGDLVQVVGPLAAGESVVTTGAFLLKTELRKDAIGAGCCEVEGGE